MHSQNCFLTLTFDAEHLPDDGSVDVRHWQNFAKRLRKRLGPFRFLHCGEYGGERFRPHYHACIFGIDFSEDRTLWKGTGEHQMFVSPTLAKLWPYGFHTIGSVSFDSAAYVAQYIMKKVTGDRAWKAYERVDGVTGETWRVKPEYATMSRNPGLGRSWFAKYANDVYPDDFVVMKGQKFRPPKYYDSLLEKEDPDLLESLKEKRRATAVASKEENTRARLEVRERVLDARLNVETFRSLE